MKKYVFGIVSLFIILGIFAYLSDRALAAGETASGATADKAAGTAEKVGYLENVLFEKLPGKERINLVISQSSPVLVSRNADGSLQVRIANLFVPESLRRTFGEGQLVNVKSVVPVQLTENGKQTASLTIDLLESVPYSVRQEGKSVLIDFSVADLPKTLVTQAATVREFRPADREARPARRTQAPRYTDRLISLDFQDADIKSVLRLMAEYGNVSIISGNDVRGNVTLAMKNVSWEEALDAILQVHGLARQPVGDVITIMTLERKKKDESDKIKAEEDQRKAEDARKRREIELLAEKGALRQILIEAKIVEVSDDFVRNLGIQWGFGQHGSSGRYGLGFAGGTNPLTVTNAQRIAYPAEIPWTKIGSTDPLTMAAVNLPSSVIGPAFGLVFGGASGWIETQLQALEVTTQGKVISSPRVVTMDNVKAIIKQGDEVPYVTRPSGDQSTDTPTVTFKEAVLRLEVKPKITEEGKISMEIKATNDTPDYAQGEKLQGNPPIRKNELESKVVVADGDTVVIGGVSRNQEDKTVSGLPWAYKIPVLGWLFKTENLQKQKRQLMIFITPKILEESGLVEDECDTSHMDSLSRCRNRK